MASYYRSIQDFGRVSYAPSAEEIYKTVCFSTKRKYAAFEAEDRHKAIGKNICRLIPTLSSYYETWIASAIKRGFKYKRSFDMGLVKTYVLIFFTKKKKFTYILCIEKNKTRFMFDR